MTETISVELTPHEIGAIIDWADEWGWEGLADKMRVLLKEHSTPEIR
jgi:hypothetical protein